MNDPQEPLFTDDQTKLLKSMMASAVAEVMASMGKHTKDQLKDGDEPSTSASEWL